MADADTNEAEKKGVGFLGGTTALGVGALGGIGAGVAMHKTAVKWNKEDIAKQTTAGIDAETKVNTALNASSQGAGDVTQAAEAGAQKAAAEKTANTIKELEATGTKLKTAGEANFFKKGFQTVKSGGMKVKGVALLAAIPATYLTGKAIKSYRNSHADRIADERAAPSNSAGRGA